MIDLHSHILPGIDDGAETLEVSLDMARAWVADGVSIVACTPHITPGVYNNTGPQIRQAVQALQTEIDQALIPLRLVSGADNHIMPDMAGGLGAGKLLSLADTRYVLVEPTHHVVPVRLDDLFFSLLVAGYVPILTHPERLTWIEGQYATIQRLAQAGVWMQITAGSLTGAFGSAPKYWSERMLDEGLVHILATDAHNLRRRPPNLSQGRDVAARRVGDDEAQHLVWTRPYGILSNAGPETMVLPSPRGGRGDDFSGAAQDESPGNRVRANSRYDDGRGERSGFAERLRRLFGQ